MRVEWPDHVLRGPWVVTGVLLAVLHLAALVGYLEVMAQLRAMGRPLPDDALLWVTTMGHVIATLAAALGAVWAFGGQKTGRSLVMMALVVSSALVASNLFIGLTYQLQGVEAVGGQAYALLLYRGIGLVWHVGLLFVLVVLVPRIEPRVSTVPVLAAGGRAAGAGVAWAVRLAVAAAVVNALFVAGMAHWEAIARVGGAPGAALGVLYAVAFAVGAWGLARLRSWSWMLLAGLAAAQTWTFVGALAYALAVPPLPSHPLAAALAALFFAGVALASASPVVLRMVGPAADPDVPRQAHG